MDSACPKAWRGRSPGAPAPRGAGIGDDAAARPVGAQRVWAFLCPNPFCSTELVIYPDHAGCEVACPSCGFEFVAPRVVPVHIAPEEDAGPHGHRAFASRVPARPPWMPRRLPPGFSPPGAAAPPSANTGQAAPPPPKVHSTAAKKASAPDALAQLARLSEQPGSAPAPAGIGRRPAPPVTVRRERRDEGRLDVAPAMFQRPAEAPRADHRTDLVLTWAVALVISAGLILAAWGVGLPDLGLGAILFLGLAVLRTVLLVRPKRPDQPPG